MKNLSTYEVIPAIENEFSVKVQPFSGITNLLPHWHEHIELLYFIEGAGRAVCNGQTFSVKKGDLVVVNSTQIHALVSAEPWEYCCVLLYPAFFSDIQVDRGMLVQNLISGDEKIKEYMVEMYRERQKKTFGSDMKIKGLSYLLYAYLIRKYAQKGREREGGEAHSLRKVHLLFDYIGKHYQERMTSAEMAGVCHVTESYFCRFFKKNFGMTPLEFLREYRVEKAAHALTHTDRSITDIAFSVGFDDLNYFSRTFRKIKGLSPGEFRKRGKGAMD